MSGEQLPEPPSRGLMVAAFAAIYLIWGSTYLVIRYAIESIPPFLMIGTRFVFAGIVLWTWARARGAAVGTRREWFTATLVGTLLLFAGNGWIAWAEKFVPSSIAALVVAAMPLWMVLLDWKNSPPTTRILLGLAIGFVGVGMLANTGRGYDNEPLKMFPIGVMIAATICWAIGSLYSRRSAKPKSTMVNVAMQMIGGGCVLLIASVACGEMDQFQLSTVTGRSLLAWTYLVIFGSLIAFPAYIWLMTASTPSLVSTYAFVNPLIAVALGCTIGAEPFSGRLLLSAFLIVVAVVLIIYRPAAKQIEPIVANLCEVKK